MTQLLTPTPTLTVARPAATIAKTTTNGTTVSAPIITSRRAWVAWMRGEETVPGEVLRAAVLDEPSRDALMLYPHRGDWHQGDPTQGRTWTLSQTELHTLWRNGAPHEDLTARVLDGLGKVLDQATTNDTENATALAAHAFIAWDSENTTAALLWTNEALQHDPSHPLATMVDQALHASRLPLWRR